MRRPEQSHTCLFSLLCLGVALPALAASPAARTVRWAPLDPSVPHLTYANRTVTLKGTTNLSGSRIQATWDFGDSSAPYSSTVANPYDVSATHVYEGRPGAQFVARLTVLDFDTGESASAEYRLEMREDTPETRIAVAIDEGLWVLHTAMARSDSPTPSGTWRARCGLVCDATAADSAITAANLLAFEVNGHLASGDPDNPYTETVVRARATLAAELGLTALPDAASPADPLAPLNQAIAAFAMPNLNAYASAVLEETGTDGIAGLLLHRQDPSGYWTGHAPPDTSAFETAASLVLLRRVASRSATTTAAPAAAVRAAASAPGATAQATPVPVVTNVSPQVSVTQSGFVRNRTTGIWSGTMTVTNISGVTIPGPVSVVLTALTSGVTMTNNTGSFNGAPFITLPSVVSLAAGQAASVVINFTNPSNGFITYTPVTYSGPFPPAPINLACPSTSALLGVFYNSALMASGGVSPYTFSNTGVLPGGLTLNPSTGAISGTPNAAANYPFTGKVVDQTGLASGTATAACSISVGSPPAFTSANTATFKVGQSSSFTISTSGFPAPAITKSGSLGTTGLNFVDNGNGTATLSGNPAANSGGTYTLNLTASNGISPNAAQTLTITVNQAPAITSNNTASFPLGQATTFTVTATGFPAPAITFTGSLGSTGLTFTDNHNGTATFSGTPASGSSGTYPLNLKAANGVSPDATQSFTLTVAKQDQTITFSSTAPANAKVAGSTYTVTATATSSLPVTFTIDAAAASVCSISGSTVSFQTPGTCVINANQTGNTNFNAAPQVQQSFAVGKGDQTITFNSTAPVNAKVAGPTYTVNATSSSTLAVTFTIDASATSVCSISGSTVSFLATGTCVIDANQAGNSNYNAAPQAQQSFAVAKGDQTITLTSTAPANAKVGGATYTVTATASSGLTPAFTIDASATSVCSISGSTVSFIAVGTCVIDANQAGNTNYNAAPQVQQSFAVAKGDQTITFTSTAPANAKVGGATYTVTATASSSLAVTFTIDATAASVCSISGSTVSFTGVGACVINANQAGNVNYNAAPQSQQSFAVAKGDQTITFTSTVPANAKVAGATYTVAATASSSLAVTFTIDATAASVCSISGSTVSFIGVGTCVIDANQAGNVNYNAAPQSQQSFAVAKGDQTITFTSTTPASAKVGGPTYTVAATASSTLAVTFTIDATATSVCSISGSTVSFIGVGTCVIDANQAGNTNYNAAPQVQQSLLVAKGDQTITFTSTTPTSAKVGGPAYTVTATASSGLAVTFTVDATAASVCSISGSAVSFIGVGTCVLDANQAGNTNYNAAPQSQQSFAVAKGDQTITFTSTSPANAKVGGATYTVTATASSSLAVTLTVDATSTSVCSISGSTVSFIGVGTCAIDANQAGNANYNAAPQSQQSFAVAKGDQTITFTSTAPVGATAGGPTYTVTATATSGLTVAFTVDASATSVCSISGSTVSFIGAGTCVIDANQAGNANYNAAPQAQQSVTVAKGDQTITFTSTVPASAKVGGATYTVTATASSGLTPAFTIDATATSVCSISGSTVSFIGVGTCVIDANQVGNTNYNAAPQVQQSFAVAKGDQTITFTSTPPVGAKVGGPTYTVIATASSGLTPVTFTVDATASSVCSISGSTVSFIGVGTCVLDANQAGNASYNAAPQAQQSFAVAKGDQTISFTSTAPVGAKVDGPTYTVTATASSGQPVTLTVDATSTSVCSISGSTVSFIGAGSCVIDGNQAGNANYNAAPQVQQSFAVAKGDQTITFTSTAPTGATVGGPTYTVTATATSGLAVVFTIDASAASVCSISGSTVSLTGPGNCVINANQPGNANYNAAPQVQQSFAVKQAPQITSANSTSFAPGKNGQTFTVQTTGFPTGASMSITDGGGFPSGVSLTNNNDGTATISGTPAAGTQGTSGTPTFRQAYPVTITANNGVAPNATQSFTLNIVCPAITVSGTAASPVTYGVAITSAQFSQTGGNGTIVWSTSGLPPGISINNASGVLSGTPTATGTYAGSVTATDAGGCTGSKAVTIAVAPQLSFYGVNSVGNTQVYVSGVSGAPTTPAKAVTPTLLLGAAPSGGVAITGATCSTGGTLSNVDATGHYIFTPDAGFRGVAICSYTGSSDTGNTGTAVSATASMTFTMNGIVWYVDNATTSGTNDGRSNTPFKTMTAVGSASTSNGDYIYVSKGSGSTTGDYTFKPSQSLVGAGATLTTTPPILIINGAAGNTPTLSGRLTLANSASISGIDMSTGSTDAIAGTSLTGINVTVRNLTTTTGVGVNVTGTGTGTGSMTFTQINANGSTNPIKLANYNGTFAVNGDGSGLANGSGGSLSNITGAVLGNAPLYAQTVSGTISLKSMNISLDPSSSTSSAYSGVYIDNNLGGSVTVNVTGCTFTGRGQSLANTSQGKSLLQFETGGTGGSAAHITANIQNSFFNGGRTYGMFADGAGDSVINLTLNQSGFGTDVNTGSAVNKPGTTITNAPPISIGVTNSSNAQVDYTITNNTFWGSDGANGAIYAVTISTGNSNSSSHLIGTFSGNQIGKAGVAHSGCANNCAGLGLLPGTAGLFAATVTGNDIRQVNSLGINFKNTVTGASGNSKATIQGNTISEPDTTGSPAFQRAIVVDPGNSNGSSMTACAVVGGASTLTNTIGTGWQVGNFIRITTNNTTGTLYLPGADTTSATTINAFVQSNNTMDPNSVNTTVGTGPISGASCPF